MKSLSTIQNRVYMAKEYEEAITLEANTYVGIGKSTQWPQSDALIADSVETVEALDNVYKNLVSVKKINGADINLVAPRVDWANNTAYTEYTEKSELFTYESKTQLPANVSATISTMNVVGSADTYFTSNLSIGEIILIDGDGINVPKVRKEIVSITNNRHLMVNSSFDYTYTQNAYSRVENLYPQYANKFYVRNTRDQVFKCLFNNGGAESTVMPEIDIGGQLPENPYIQTSDGYRWKYLYTIPSGLKEKFFDSQWMPVIDDEIVSEAAVNGRIDIIDIVNGGTGYVSNGTSASANVISIIGDGTGANVTANVLNGVIVGVNILDGGSGYTNATIQATGTGANANLIAVISPRGGHGSNVDIELGATHLMVSVELDGTVNGNFPTENDQENFKYRQISLLKNVRETDGGAIGNDSTYVATYVVTTSTTLGSGRFYLNDKVYQGPSYAAATFVGTIAFWDETSNEIWINNTSGTITDNAELKSYSEVGNPTTSVEVFNIVEPEIQAFSGDVLYVRNNSAIERDDDQAEQIRILVSF